MVNHEATRVEIKALGVQEGHKEDKSGWSGFLVHLKQRGLKSVRLVISGA